MNNEKKFIKLTPFKMQILQSFPFIDEDFDAITNYELLCKVVEYLNKTVDNVDLLNEKVTEFENYFDNLDVQDEINNKLDEMAKSGELSEIIAEYLSLAGMLSFNTVADLKSAENLINGSFACTLGFYSINDSGNATYKIRTITNDDIVDEMFIIALHDNTLVAELIYDSELNIKKIGCQENSNITTKLQNAINKVNNILIPNGSYNITSTIKTYANNTIRMENDTYLNLSNIDGLYVDGNSVITGGNIIAPENYSHTAVTMMPTSATKLDEKIGGLFNLAIKNTTAYSTDSVAIGFSFVDNKDIDHVGITYQSFENIHIINFDYGFKAVNNDSSKWINSLNADNIKMAYCKKFIYANVGHEFTGNKFTNIHIQVDKDNLDYVIYLGGKCEDNYFNIIEWDLNPALNTNAIYLSSSTQNNKIEADRLFNYGTLKVITDEGKNNYITSAFIENTYLQRTNLKTIDLTSLDNTKAYPVLFESMCNIKLWRYSQTGDLTSYLYAYIDAVSPRAGGMLGNYFVRLSTLASNKIIPKINANNTNRYVAVYLRGGYKYNFIDYNFQYLETLSVEYYYDPTYNTPYKVVTDTFTSGGVTYTPITTDNSIPRGMYYTSYGTIDLDKDSTPLTLS